MHIERDQPPEDWLGKSFAFIGKDNQPWVRRSVLLDDVHENKLLDPKLVISMYPDDENFDDSYIYFYASNTRYPSNASVVHEIYRMRTALFVQPEQPTPYDQTILSVNFKRITAQKYPMGVFLVSNNQHNQTITELFYPTGMHPHGVLLPIYDWAMNGMDMLARLQ